MATTGCDPRAASNICRQVTAKAVRAWQDGVLGPKVRRHLSNVVYVPFVSVQRSRQLAPADRALDLASGFSDHRGTVRELRCSDTALARIAAAFRAAERDGERDRPPELEVRGLWAEWLELHYLPLRRMLRDGDLASMHGLLENLHRDPMSTGVGGTVDDLNRVPAPFAGAYYRALWCHYRDLLEAVRPAWDDVAGPVVGNPRGVLLDGRLIQIETLRHAHHATQMLELLDGVDDARILEIGGGLGGQAYQCLSLAKGRLGTYTIIDLPEVAALASYCLIAVLGEAAVRLYGEATSADDPPAVEVLPTWCISSRLDGSADLVFNAHSFSEMDGASAGYYLHHVERVSRRFFFHINHETRFRYRSSDGTPSVNRVGSEMRPDPETFVLAFRRPQTFSRPENRANTGFAYLYGRRDSALRDRALRSWPGLTSTTGLRILFLASSAERYGSDRALLELVTALDRFGHVVAVVLPHEGPLADALTNVGVESFVAPLAVVERSMNAKQLARLASSLRHPSVGLLAQVQRFAPDIVYSNTSHVIDGPAVARALAVPHVWHLREIERVPDAVRRLYGRWLARTSDRVFPISDAVRQAYFQEQRPDVTVVPDGVDLAGYTVEAWSPPEAFGPSRPLRLLSLGRISPWKGQIVAIRAVISLLDEGRPAHLRVVGGALTKADRTYRDHLLDVAGPHPNIQIEDEVADPRPLYRWCDVLVHSSVQPEPFGRVIVEAMASGRAVVASDLGGPREIVSDCVDGRLVAPDRPDDLAQVLRSFSRSPAALAALASAAGERAHRFSVEATAQAVHVLLSDVAATRK